MIIIFIKFPHEGKVKTRLAKDIGEQEATRFYKDCVEKTIQKIRPLPYQKIIFVSNKEDIPQAKNWLGEEFLYFEQKGDDLGERLLHSFQFVFECCFENCFENCKINKAIVIGSDIPELSKNEIQEAFESLENIDVVIGPSPDGGYYLMGMKKLHSDLFQNISWSSEQVLKQTQDKIKALSLSSHHLKSLRDADTLEDYLFFSREPKEPKD